MRQSNVPIIEALYKYVADGAVAFHTPGHKQGKSVPEKIKDMVTPLGFKMDVSLMAELDDLFEPEGCIKDAQNLAAELYNADDTFFMINGTTGAIHVMIMSAVGPGEKIIVPRNVHKSILGAIILAGAQPVFVEPVINNELGLAMGVTMEKIQEVIEKNTDAKAVLLVYPTYYGVASDIKKIAELVHKYNMPLLVDEAHGPHLKFSRYLPQQAIDAGADMSAQSTHKILSAFTQTSMLHVKYDYIKKERVSMMNGLIQSTSPNYLLLAGLDAARWQMAQFGADMIDNAYLLAQKLRNAINEIPDLYCFGDDIKGQPGCFAIDYTKVTVTVKGLGITGYEAEQILRYKYKIQCELADMYNLLFIISLADGEKEINILLKALQSLAVNNNKVAAAVPVIAQPAMPQMKLLPREAVYAAYKIIDFKESAGQVCAETISFYPPGIPLIYPGEVITAELIAYVQQAIAAGGKVAGPFDVKLNKIKVISGTR